MNAILNREENSTVRVMETLIARDGLWKVVIALVALLARKKRKAGLLCEQDLSAHLRRDLGLPPLYETREPLDLRQARDLHQGWDLR